MSLHPWGVYRMELGGFFSRKPPRYALVSSHKSCHAAEQSARSGDQIHRTAHKGRGWNVRGI